MNQNKQIPISGIQIENTLSMAVQERNHRRNPLHLLVIAFCGTLGGIGTFLTMFQPQCSIPVLTVFLTVGFLYFSVTAYFPKKLLPLRLLLTLIYAGLLYVFWKPFSSGFIHLVNTVYQVIFMTEWERFSVSAEMSEHYCVTVFLIFALFPILYMLCHAAINYQNFFLSLIPTFPLAQIGFYYGVPADHFFATLLLAFWFSMAAVQMSGFGAYHGDGQNSFLRRKNTFFPISSMRFMVTEKIGIIVLAAVMLLSFLIGQILHAVDYQRSDSIKLLRSNVQDRVASLMLGDSVDAPELWKSLWPKKKKNDRIVTPLGEEARREFENIPLSGLTLSDLPDGRLYLKFRVGEVYDSNSWSKPEESVYRAPVFSLFEELDYYPQEFLYANVHPFNGEDITMELHDVRRLPECVPYAFEEQPDLQCQFDNAFSAFSTTYTITRMQDFETMLLNSDRITLTDSQLHYSNLHPQDHSVFGELFDDDALSALVMTSITGSYQGDPRQLEALLLCRYGYRDFAAAINTQVPDTAAMQAVREKYASILGSYRHDTASAADTIAFLQELRETVCSDMIYTLAPGRTPPTEDFVEYFLLKNNRGYCMHYATAGVMLARMAGIPARYCEGYMVDLDTSPSLRRNEDHYSLEILDSNAHAWMEVYIDGWGWIPFEFTFTESSQPATVESTMPATETVTSIVTSYVQSSAETDPSGMTATRPAPSAPEKTDHTALWIVLGIFAGFLFIAAVILFVHLLHRSALRRREKAFMQPDRNAAALSIYAYLCRLLSFSGADMRAGRTTEIIEHAAEISSRYLPDDSIADAVEIAAKAKFSAHTISEDERTRMLQTARQLAAGICRDASRWQKFRLKYILHLL